jgi:hypothetical protein
MIVGGDQVYAVLGDGAEDVPAMLHGGFGAGDGDRARVCRALLDGGIVVLGDPDPLRDPFLSELLEDWDDHNRA